MWSSRPQPECSSQNANSGLFTTVAFPDPGLKCQWRPVAFSVKAKIYSLDSAFFSHLIIPLSQLWVSAQDSSLFLPHFPHLLHARTPTVCLSLSSVLTSEVSSLTSLIRQYSYNTLYAIIVLYFLIYLCCPLHNAVFPLECRLHRHGVSLSLTVKHPQIHMHIHPTGTSLTFRISNPKHC